VVLYPAHSCIATLSRRRPALCSILSPPWKSNRSPTSSPPSLSLCPSFTCSLSLPLHLSRPLAEGTTDLRKMSTRFDVLPSTSQKRGELEGFEMVDEKMVVGASIFRLRGHA
jgi:hypothetical protein